MGKSNRATRQKLLDEPLPNLTNDRWPFTRWIATKTSSTFKYKMDEFEDVMVVPWLNKKVLVEEPKLLLTLLS